MDKQPRCVTVTLESRVECMDLGEEITRRLAGSAGFSEDDLHKISMSVRECLINALQHGNRGDVAKKIGLSVALHADRLVVQVTDQGGGFDIGAVANPLADESLLKTSGRGIFLVRCFMDDLKVECGKNGGTVVTLTKRYPSDNNGSGPGMRVEKEREQ
jgi:serine/threonine-protein kinase RsbW